MKKKGQVSVFVIIGIILVLVVSFLFVNSKFEIFVDHETKIMNQISDVVDSCLQKSAKDGVFQLGFQGGVIEIPKIKALDPRKFSDLGFKVPNWDSESGDIPVVSSMEIELVTYIQNEGYNCIVSNLNTLSDIFEMEVDENLIVSSQINDENVIVDAFLPITFSEIGSDEILSIDSFYVKLDSKRLGDMYNLATQIYSIEGREHFVENLVLDQIYSASDYTSKNAMPSEGMSFSCTPRVWTIPQLAENLQNLNNNNFKYLYFEGTRPIDDVINANLNDEFGTTYMKAYFDSFYKFELPETRPTYENYRVEVFMPETNFLIGGKTFEVTPSDGNIVQSIDMKVDVAGGKMPIPCVQIFHHLYTLDYDLIVKITDYNEDGNRFVFQFPLRVEIEDNTPKRSVPFPMLNVEKVTATSAKFCSGPERKYPLRIFSLDANTGDVLDGVNISYKCMNLFCDIGQTSKPFYHGFQSVYSQSVLETEFPFCVNGEVIAEKEGYYRAKTRVTTDDSLIGASPTPYYDLELIPLKEFKVDLGSFLVVYGGGGHRVRDESDGQIFITIQNKEHDFTTQVLWPTEDGIMDTLQFLDVEDMAYNVSVLFTDSEYELRGIFDIKNWQPDIHSGNEFFVTIPASSSVLTEETFIEFYEESNILVLEDSTYGLEIK